MLIVGVCPLRSQTSPSEATPIYAYLNSGFGLFLLDTESGPHDFVAPVRFSSTTDIYGQYTPQGRLTGLMDHVAFRPLVPGWSCDVFMPERINPQDGGGSSFGSKMTLVVEATAGDRADDFIDLGSLDANVDVAGDQSFTPVDELTGETGQATLTWLPPVDDILRAADLGGDGLADMRIAPYDDFDNFLGVWG